MVIPFLSLYKFYSMQGRKFRLGNAIGNNIDDTVTIFARHLGFLLLVSISSEYLFPFQLG